MGGFGKSVHTHRRRVAIAAVGALLAATSACTADPPEPAPTNVDTVETPGGTVTATVAPGVTVEIAAEDMSVLPPVSSNVTTPVGALSVNVSGIAPGSAAEVVVELQTPVDRARKLIDGEWQRFDYDGTTGVTVSPDGMTLTLHLLDGGRGDTDGAANGVIVDPVLPEEVTGIEVTTESTPFISQGMPYSFQLEADGPDTNAITWSVISGGVPNMSLDSNGLISGTWNGFNHGISPAVMRVQATDGETTDTKLLMFTTHPITPIMGAPTGAPLPDGTAIDYMDGQIGGVFAPPQRTYLANGTIVDPVGMDVLTSKRAGNPQVSPDATMVLVRWANPNDQPPVPGPPTVIDADTGETIAELVPPTPSWGAWDAAWSPDGTYLALPDGYSIDGVDGPIYETDGWTVAHEIVGLGQGRLRWSADGSRVFTTGSTDPLGPATTVEVLQAPLFTSGATLTLPAAGCQAEDLSSQGQLVATCTSPGPALVTMSAVDGSGLNNVFSGCDPVAPVVPCLYNPLYPRFSPDGEHLVWTGFKITSVSPMTFQSVIAVQEATAGSPGTPIVVAPEGSGSLGYSKVTWR